MDVQFYRKIVLVIAAHLLFACSHNSQNSSKLVSDTPQQPKVEKNTTISTTLLDWNKTLKIPLLEHQLKPIDYLEKNPDIKGLLVYHYLGTGKTFLALGMAERYQDKKVVLLVPRFLKNHWIKNIDIFTVKNKDRFSIFTHDKVEELSKMDLKNSIVIIDESHNIINKLYSPSNTESDLYSKLYINIQSASKILSLSGTPIYQSTGDIAYQINMVGDKEILPYNTTKFRNEFTTIDTVPSLTRGYLAESSTTLYITSAFASPIALAIFGPGSLIPIIAFNIGVSVAPMLVRTYIPITDSYYFRSFDASKLKPISSDYITYYNFSTEDYTQYPKKTISYKEVRYDDYQINLFMSMMDSSLSSEQIMLLQKDFGNHDYKNTLLQSSKIQDQMKNSIITGLQIGNLSHKEEGKLVFPKKFDEALKIMTQDDRPVVIYSNFYQNGIIAFKNYLDSKGYSGQYAILEPTAQFAEYNDIITRYNSGKLKFLMLHPEITEGVSLIGTSQIHILEPTTSKAMLEQIIGRTVRYKSHAHLPENQRHVQAYVWAQVPSLSMFDLTHGIALRKSWNKNYREVNYYGNKDAIDPNNKLKILSPDQSALNKMNSLNKAMESLQDLLKKYSIENNYVGVKK